MTRPTMGPKTVAMVEHCMKFARGTMAVPVLTLCVGALALPAGGCRMMDSIGTRWRGGPRPLTAAEGAPHGAVRPLPRPQVPSEQVVAGTDAMNRARILAEQGLLENAIKEFERAIEENPLLTGAHMGLGNAQFESGNVQAAEVSFSEAARLEPRNFGAQYMHGVVLQELGRLNESIRAYLRAVNLRPDDFQANMNLGMAYLQSGEPQSALAYSKHAVELRPQDGPARANLGVVYQTLGRHEDAVTEFQQAAELTELSPELLTNLADSYGRTKRYEEMVATLEQVVEVKPSAAAFERLGSGQFRLAMYDQALTSFRRSTELDSSHYPAFNGVGVCLLQQWITGQQSDLSLKEEGLRALRRSLQIEKSQPKVMELLTRYR